MDILRLVVEIIITILIGYMIWHEDDLVELEDVLWQWAKRGFKKGEGSNENY